MDDALLAALAHAAGLTGTLAAFPAEVRAAAVAGSGFAASLAPQPDPAAEPWPPMRPREGA